jgi:hypothetical protein
LTRNAETDVWDRLLELIDKYPGWTIALALVLIIVLGKIANRMIPSKPS